MLSPRSHLILAVFALSAITTFAQLPAFPGAEGFGACSTGGRGGDVYIVSNLNADGPGSFKRGILTVPSQGRTIVFAMSGYIPINKLYLKASNVTIAGQTAPGDGVALRDSMFWISGSNVVARFIGFRQGHAGNGGDCLETDSGARNLMIDHCDALFSTDENFSMFRSAPPTMTFQWSINAWGLQHHSAGGLWLIDHTTAHHTLWADNHTRNPKVIKPQAFDWANNVTFGWDIGMNLAGADVPGTYKVNLRGSSFIHGGKVKNAIFGGGETNGTMPFTVYMNDCGLDGNGNGKLDVTSTDYEIISGNLYHRQTVPFLQTQAADPARPGDPVLGVPVRLDDRLTAYKKVISQAGIVRLDIDPAKLLRDEVTALLIQDVMSQHRRIITNENDLAVSNQGFGTLRSAPAPADLDADGMPDFWEKTLGWNPNSDDHNTELPSRNGFISEPAFFPPETPAGYTRLEEYLHFLAIPHGVATKNVAVRVDLRKFTAGFTASPVFKITEVSGGTAMQSGDGGYLVTFTPAKDFTGRSKFDFTVTDSEGSSWKQSCALLVREL
jgi:hypothetical protein